LVVITIQIETETPDEAAEVVRRLQDLRIQAHTTGRPPLRSERHLNIVREGSAS
jgi:hypothetical protein